MTLSKQPSTTVCPTPRPGIGRRRDIRIQPLRWLLASTALCFSLFANADPVKPISVQLSWKYQYQFSPIIAALEMGFYREAGLDVSIIEGGPGIDAVTQVLQNKAQYGIYSSSILVKYGEKKPVVALAAIMQHSPVALIAHQDRIHSTLDLAGKTIAVSPDTKDEIIAYLRSSGISENQVNIISKSKLGLGNLEDVDAISAYISNEGYYLSSTGNKYMLISPRSAGIDFFGNILFTSQAHLKDNPEQVKAFRKATLLGLKYSLDHPEVISDIILRKYNTQQKTREHLLYEAEKIRSLTRPDIVEPGHMSTGRWNHVASVYSGLKKIPPDLELEPFIYNPNTLPDMRWLYALFVITLVILSAVSLSLWQTRRLTKRLKSEIIEREVAQAALQSSEMRFSDLFDKNPDPCWLIDGEKIIECNRAAIQFLKLASKKQLISLPVSSIAIDNYPPNSNSKLNDMLNMAHNLGVHRFDWALRLQNSSLIPVEITLAKYDYRGKEILYCVWRDITERKRTEKMKDDFVSTVSHELRTPLTSLIGALGLIDGGAMGEVPEKMKPLTSIALNNAKRLLFLINEILDLSRIEAGQMNYTMEKVSIDKLIDQAILNSEHFARSHEVEFILHQIEHGLEIYGDESRLLQAINNLLSNAIKFSPSHNFIDIEVKPKGAWVIIYIRDYGKGIPKDVQSRLFEKSSQTDSSDMRKMGRMGIGLSISKAIIDAHAGEIAVMSEEGLGSTFAIKLKRAATG